MWATRQKRREFDLMRAEEFHKLYGEFFSLWKKWNSGFRKDDKPSGASQQALFASACEMEGRNEALLLRIASTLSLTEMQQEAIGEFRQLFQRLRESIRDFEPLAWDSSGHEEYKRFKELACHVSAIVVLGKEPDECTLVQGQSALLAVTSNRHENRKRRLASQQSTEEMVPR